MYKCVLFVCLFLSFLFFECFWWKLHSRAIIFGIKCHVHQNINCEWSTDYQLIACLTIHKCKLLFDIRNSKLRLFLWATASWQQRRFKCNVRYELCITNKFVTLQAGTYN